MAGMPLRVWLGGNSSVSSGDMKAYRASILRFDDQGAAVFDKDGLLVVGVVAGSPCEQVLAVGPYADLIRAYPGIEVEHLPGRIIAPGFIDLHVHYPQIDVIGSPASGLLPWLENYTFPQESRFSDAAHSADAARFFRTTNGITLVTADMLARLKG